MSDPDVAILQYSLMTPVVPPVAVANVPMFVYPEGSVGAVVEALRKDAKTLRFPVAVPLRAQLLTGVLVVPAEQEPLRAIAPKEGRHSARKMTKGIIAGRTR